LGDEIHVRNGKTYATITDDRPDEPRHRPISTSGPRSRSRTNKLKWDKSNPTGHGVAFLSRAGYVFCSSSLEALKFAGPSRAPYQQKERPEAVSVSSERYTSWH